MTPFAHVINQRLLDLLFIEQQLDEVLPVAFIVGVVEGQAGEGVCEAPHYEMMTHW